MGDVHPLGNPHYWLDPGNGRRITQAIAKKLAEVSPADTAYFNQRYADFDRRLAEAEKRWDTMMAPYKGLSVANSQLPHNTGTNSRCCDRAESAFSLGLTRTLRCAQVLAEEAIYDGRCGDVMIYR
jgi:hypothetical protein